MYRGKRPFLIAMAICIVFGFCGCGGTKKVQSTLPEENQNTISEEIQNIKEEAAAYLSNHYPDTFSPKLYTPKNWAYEYESLIFTSQKYPDAQIEVRAYKNEDGDYRFKDNYFRSSMMADAVCYGEFLLQGTPGVVKVRFPYTIWSDDLGGANSFEGWKAQGTACVDIFVFSSTPLSAAMQREIVGKVKADRVYGSVQFVVTEDESLLCNKTLDDILNNQKEYVVAKKIYNVEPS